MVAASPRALVEDEDRSVILSGMAWQDYEAFLAIRGDRSGVRMYFLDGAIEIMSPSKNHEGRATMLGRLLEAWAEESDVDLNGFGSWTLKREFKQTGAEPDKCYILGPPDDRETPDLVIEVEWTRQVGLEKEEIYRRLGIRELWTIQQDGRLVVRSLEKEAYAERKKSKLFPALDLTSLLSFLDTSSQTKSVRAFRATLRTRRRRS